MRTSFMSTMAMKLLRNKNTWYALGGAILLGMALSALDGAGLVTAGRFWPGVLSYSVLLFLSFAGLAWARQLFQASKTANRAAWTAFLLRLVLGVTLMLILPLGGYEDNPASQAGYVFKDSFTRDTQAWELAQSGQPAWLAFSGMFSGDQYGGMLALSAAVYRALSPDFHRPFLILIITAAASVWGVLAGWGAMRVMFGEGEANITAWIMALYPEAVLLGASHMREALVIPAVALAWGGVVLQREGRLCGRSCSLLMIASGILVLLLIQPAAALVALLVMIIYRILEPGRRFSWRWAAVFLGVFLAALVILYSIWATLPSLSGVSGWQVFAQWLENNFNLQSLGTVRASGWMQNIIGDLGQQWKGTVILAYGIFQPVLPAALIAPGAPIWRVIGSFRGLGWYLLVPFLGYNFAQVWFFRKMWRHQGDAGAKAGGASGITEQTKGLFNRRAQLRWLALAMWAWMLIASANGGGDQWDNPRYRAMFLIWQAVLAAWTWSVVRTTQDRWFWRFAWIEAVFVGLFIYWYVGRKYVAAIVLDIWVIMILFGIASAGILLNGWWHDRQQKPKEG